MKNIILVDLDGTLADIEHRRHLVNKTKPCQACDGKGTYPHPSNGETYNCQQCSGKGVWPDKPDWPAFFKACVDDKPLQTTIALIDMLIEVGKEIWIVSGRSDEVFTETHTWLERHGIVYDRLFMRAAGDFTPDDVLKKQWLDTIIPKDRVFCVFDDRDKVVKMWRDEGLTCYQVAPGDF